MEFIQSLLESSSIPVVTAFLLGILTAISPCPLATNITAIGYISKDIESKHRIFWGGILYTAGRIITYTALGFILIPILREGASMFAIQKAVSKYGEMLIAPTLILIGLFMLFGNRLNLPKFGFRGSGSEKQRIVGRIAFGGAVFAGVLSDKRRFLFRDADADVGGGNGRLSASGGLCHRHGSARDYRGLDSGVQRGWAWKILQPDAGISKVDE